MGGGTLGRGDPMKTFLNFRNNLLLLYKNLPSGKRERVIFTRMIMDGISAFRFLFHGALKDFLAVIRAHVAYFGIKHTYRGMNKQSSPQKNNVIVTGIYGGSIVADFFLKGKRRFEQLNQVFTQEKVKQ